MASKFDVAAYQDALEKYNKAVTSHNFRSRRFNESIVKDVSGRTLVAQPKNVSKVYSVDPVSGNLNKSELPSELQGIELGYSALPDEKNWMLVRVSPEAATNIVNPGSFSLKAPKAPSMTFADQRKLEYGTPAYNLAAAERGLIGQIIRNR